jgi:succinyl-diaminopimelate desuccinylase
MAAMLHALQAVTASGEPIAGRLYFICCVSGETGRDDAIRNVVEREGVRADMAVVYGNSIKLQLGNRGRIDMRVTVHGQPCHSSRPKEGCNAITGALEVISRLSVEIDSSRAHPELGTASLTVNGFRSHPDSTHTVQSRCDISLDRRLLPGEDPDSAAAEIVRVAMQVDGMLDPASGKPMRVSVTRGAYMHPSLVTDESLCVQEIRKSCRVMLGYEPQATFGQSAFDQGYLNHVGISTINFGPGEQEFAHTDNDVASVQRTYDAARVFAFLIADYLGGATRTDVT